MELLARALRWIADATRSTPHRRGGDPADMGTAFGLDATTSLESAAEPAAEEPRRDRRASPFEPRPPRRSAY